MKKASIIFTILLTLCALQLAAYSVPIADKGRFKPLDTEPKSIWNDQLKSRNVEQNRNPLLSRLAEAPGPLTALPSKLGKGRWFPLNALLIDVYDEVNLSWKPVGNFTLYPDAAFEMLQKEYRKEAPDIQLIEKVLAENYTLLAGKKYHGDLYYPTLFQLKVETIYFAWPWIAFTILLYFFGFAALLKFPRTGLGLTIAAFILHTAILAMRILILKRPPVSNMFETVIYVPWIAVATGFFFSWMRSNVIPLLASIASSICLLLILKVSQLDQSLENVQAVLDSQFWLTIHVLMVVGSYGVLIFSGIMGHIYLLFNRREDLASTIIASMYLGTGLLIAGTLLGGVWAAQSWGRFWDWDPKESWAFISSCIYLAVIHAYRFKKIGSFGLAIGSILGLVAIGFTWYGVNYILGTGMHSYGFGQGGEGWFYAFALLEGSIISGACIKKACKP